ncbi:hypothetical protein D3C76_857550 [compost metagenome]
MPNFADWQVIVGLILLIAFLTETIVEFIKTQFETLIGSKAIQIAATVIGIVLAWAFQAKLFVGVSVYVDVIGYIVIGLVASRGASYAHNWLDKLPRK